MLKTQRDCKDCCTCRFKKESRSSPSKLNRKVPDEKKKAVPGCTCICKCFGFFNYRDPHFDYKSLPTFGDADIKIIYRDRIRVFYGKVESAIADGYTDFDANAFSAKRGFLYSFTGLRGDAKRLYR